MNQASDTALIDCRPLAEYVLGHIPRACSLPTDSLFTRMHELPKRTTPIHLCGKAEDLKAATEYLIDRGHEVIEQTLWTEALQQELSASDTLEKGEVSHQLWQAAPLLQRFVNEIVPKHNIAAGKGLDIACGAGRDLAYLAAQGWEMTGIDRSIDSLERVATLAKYCKVEIPTLQLDTETGTDPFTLFEDGSFDLICVARYLHRPLFPYIKRLLKPHGVIIYQTFMVGCEETKIGRPKNPNFLLKNGELAETFAGYDVLLDEVEMLEDGRPVAAFIARQKLPNP
ncbi:methyltransferase domain-containing protein [Leucothrix arctica]|uniref:Methyltransferase type 11 n=1 Tax=Leucothrix arctica TaxID=1481894 RepID=A0A317CH87_9GAMM|nr:methyltransferase domain-containing protein [Leucothrix arctica]PWQ97908.1 methyltransferase type 11 [Leucothrix arctica]